MTDDIVAILRSERNNCRCNAYYSGECCCDAKWAEDYVIFAADEIERLRKEREEYAHEIYRLRAAIDNVVAETYGKHQPESASAEDLDAGKEPLWCGSCGPGGGWPCDHRIALDALKKARRD